MEFVYIRTFFRNYIPSLIFPGLLFCVGGCKNLQMFPPDCGQRISKIEKCRKGEKRVTLPNETSANETTVSGGEKFFSDHALDLYEVIDIAFARNPVTKIAWHQKQIAVAQKLKSESTFYPRVSVSLNGARAEQMGAPGADGRHLTSSCKNTIFPQIDITYSLFKFGAHREASLAALSALRAADFQFNQTLQDVAYGVAMAYFFLDSAMATVEANGRNLEDTRVALDAANNRYRSGLTNKQDLLKAQAAHSAAIFNLEHSRSAVEAARAQLANAMGIRITDQLCIVGSREEAIPDMDNMEQLIGEALARRQDLQSQREILRSTEHAWKSKGYDRYPEVLVGLSASRRKVEEIPGMYNHFELYAALKWDLFDGFLKKSEQLMAHEEMKIAHQRLRTKALDIGSQVWEYFYALKSAIRKLDAAKEAENCAREAFSCTQEAYGNGLSSFTDLLMAQNELSTARNKLVCARNDLAVGWVHLVYSTGKILEQ
ncbi:MAG: TolC family protein [Puniceicoccales bacterium]|jgi:outer membrane protein TolC|nr:TolC family protein [Puniceicoccales bacterium]